MGTTASLRRQQPQYPCNNRTAVCSVMFARNGPNDDRDGSPKFDVGKASTEVGAAILVPLSGKLIAYATNERKFGDDLESRTVSLTTDFNMHDAFLRIVTFSGQPNELDLRLVNEVDELLVPGHWISPSLIRVTVDGRAVDLTRQPPFSELFFFEGQHKSLHAIRCLRQSDSHIDVQLVRGSGFIPVVAPG